MPPVDDPEPDAVLTVAGAAELLGVSEWLVLQQIRLQQIPHRRCGRRILLSRDRLLAWVRGDEGDGRREPNQA